MGLVNFADEGPFLLIDTSYQVYAIAYRAMNIYSKHYDVPACKQELHTIDFTDDSDFLHIFNRNFISSVKKLHSQFMTTASKTLFALDCPKKDIWRREHFDGYKLHRMVQVGPPEGLNTRPIFKYVVNTLLPTLVEKGFGHTASHPHGEADDIIGVTHSIIREREPDRRVVILASDHDLMQLIDGKTDIMTTQNTNMVDKACGDPKRDLLEKILVGDGSDGIPGCFTKQKGDKVLCMGFGKVACSKLLDDRELLMQKFEEYPEAREQFKLNQQIVDFKNIPQNIRASITEKVTELFYG
jgi:5'-3' exonuclease